MHEFIPPWKRTPLVLWDILDVGPPHQVFNKKAKRVLNLPRPAANKKMVGNPFVGEPPFFLFNSSLQIQPAPSPRYMVLPRLVDLIRCSRPPTHRPCVAPVLGILFLLECYSSPRCERRAKLKLMTLHLVWGEPLKSVSPPGNAFEARSHPPLLKSVPHYDKLLDIWFSFFPHFFSCTTFLIHTASLQTIAAIRNCVYLLNYF